MKIFSASRFVNEVDTAKVQLRLYAYGFSSHRSQSAFRTLNKLCYHAISYVANVFVDNDHPEELYF